MTRVLLLSEGGIRIPSGDQESAGCDAERHVVVKASPASTFKVIEAQFLLEFLIVALDPPAQFGSFHEHRESRIRRQGRKPIFGRRAFALRPFDEQPFFGIGLRAPVVPMRGPNRHGGEAGTKRFVDAFAPCDVTPGVSRQRLGEVLGLRRPILRVAPHQRRRPTLPGPCLGRERTRSRRPKPGRLLNADDISQAHARNAVRNAVFIL